MKFQTRQRTIRIAVLAITALILGCTSYFQKNQNKVPQADAYWQNVDLSPSILTVRAYLCTTSKENFIGCYRAAKALLSLEELSSLSKLLPNWNEDDEALLTRMYFRSKHAINFPNVFGRLSYEIRVNIPRDAQNEAVAYALNRWLTSVDPHARLEPSKWESDQAYGALQIEGGVGFRWKTLRGKAVITKIRDGSPADKARVHTGDIILALDGVEFHRASPRRKHYLLMGDGSSPVNVTLLRGKNRFTVSLAPATYVGPNLEFAMDQGVANIRIHDFRSEYTCRDTGRLLLKAERLGAKMIHFDLRNNPGGAVEEALCVAGLLLGPNWKFAELRPIPHTLKLFPFVAKPLKRTTLYTDRGQLTMLPVFVSVNHNTASAAEMLAAALQDHGRAWIEGTRTYGKGTMQSEAHPWGRKDLSLHYSTHLIYRPTGLPLHHRGVEPDKGMEKDKASTSVLLREENFYPRFPSLRGA